MVEVSDDRFAELVEDAFARCRPSWPRCSTTWRCSSRTTRRPTTPTCWATTTASPSPSATPSYGGQLPDRIVVFRNPTLAICDTEADVVRRGRHHRRARDRPPLRHRRRPPARARVRLMDVQRSADRFVTETRRRHHAALVQLRRALRPRQHRVRADHRDQRGVRAARRRLRRRTTTPTSRSSPGCSTARSRTRTPPATAASSSPAPRSG